MTTTRQFLDAVRRYKEAIPSEAKVSDALKALSDEHFRTAVLVVAEMFVELKTEAVRRGIWDDFKGVKIKQHKDAPPH